MNDPHVQALVYKIEHADSVDYGASDPVEQDTVDFKVRTEDDHVRFELKKHYSSADFAREVVNRYVKVWELDALLRDPSQEFVLRYCHSEMVDRCPVPGRKVAAAHPVKWHFSLPQPTVTHGKPFPQPPLELTLDPCDREVVYMEARLKQYYRHSTHLPDLANLCLTTVMEPFRKKYPSQKLIKGAGYYGISKNVLKRMSNLAANKGGANEARKAQGTGEGKEFSTEERRFLESCQGRGNEGPPGRRQIVSVS